VNRVAPPEPTAAVLVVGDEVLSGRVTDLNSIYLCRRLSELGVSVKRGVLLPDEVPTIAAEVAACAARYTHVLTSGGVGPTHDDVTLAGVAAGLERPLERHPEAEAVIRAFYGADMAEAALRMADLPRGAEMVKAEGIRFPVTRVENVWVFPGSPRLLKAKFEAVQGHFAHTPFVTRALHLDASEPEIAPFLAEVQARFPEVAIGSYPQEPDAPVRLVLTVKGRDGARVEGAVKALADGLPGAVPAADGAG
jgi:FAD synthetase